MSNDHNCETFRERLLEQDAPNWAALREEAGSCDECLAELQLHQSLRGGARKGTPGLGDDRTAALLREARTARPARSRGPQYLAMAAGLLLAAGLFALLAIKGLNQQPAAPSPSPSPSPMIVEDSPSPGELDEILASDNDSGPIVTLTRRRNAFSRKPKSRQIARKRRTGSRLRRMHDRARRLKQDTQT